MKFLIDIDTLLDTRLGLMDELNPEAAKQLVVNPEYYRRTSDDFSGMTPISKATYQSAWENRQASVLERSIMTNFLLWIKRVSHEEVNHARFDPLTTEVSFTINFWPYRLATETMAAVTSAIQFHLNPMVKIDYINRSPLELNPKFLREHYETYAVYDFGLWYRKNAIVQQDFFLPNVTVIAPRLWNGEAVELTAEEREIVPNGDLYDFIAKYSTPFIRLMFFSIDHFCILQHWMPGNDQPLYLEVDEPPPEYNE